MGALLNFKLESYAGQNSGLTVVETSDRIPRTSTPSVSDPDYEIGPQPY